MKCDKNSLKTSKIAFYCSHIAHMFLHYTKETESYIMLET